MTDRELMQQALEALQEINKLSIGENAICLPAEIDGAMDALRERLAQPERKPWVRLTDEEIDEIGRPYQEKDRGIRAWGLFACAVEGKLKEKNT